MRRAAVGAKNLYRSKGSERPGTHGREPSMDTGPNQPRLMHRSREAG